MACHSHYSELGSLYINLIFQQPWKGGTILSSFSLMKKLSRHLPKVAQPGKSRVEFEAKLSGSRVHMCNSYATFTACVLHHHSSEL